MLDVKFATFITVAKIKNFTKAAQILNLTQPAVSQHIKQLEKYYGVSLVKKQGKEITVTEEGLILYKYAMELEGLYRNLESELRNKRGIRKVYSVGASMTIGGYVLPRILAEHKKAYKNVDIRLQVSNTEEITYKLVNREIDIALIEGNFDKNKFYYKKFKDDEMVLAASTKHLFCKRDKVSLEEVLNGKLILRERGSGTREIFENRVEELGFDTKTLTPYMELGSISAIKSLVEENLGYTIISRETIKKELSQGSIKIIPIEGLKIFREFNFTYLRDYNREFVEEFIRFCYLHER